MLSLDMIIYFARASRYDERLWDIKFQAVPTKEQGGWSSNAFESSRALYAMAATNLRVVRFTEMQPQTALQFKNLAAARALR